MSRSKPNQKTLHDAFTRLQSCSKETQFNLNEGETVKVSLPHWDDALQRVYEKAKVANEAYATVGDVELRSTEIQIFNMLRTVANYFEGEFEPKTADEDFLAELYTVWSELISGWYFSGVWVGYGEEFINYEREAIKEKHVEAERSKFWSRLRVYTRTTSTVEEGKQVTTYHSLLSGASGLLLDESKLVYFGADGAMYWIRWRSLVKDFLSFNQKFIRQFNAMHKRIVYLVNDEPQLAKELIQYDNHEIHIEKNNKDNQSLDNNICKPFQFVPPELPIQFLATFQAFFDLNASFLGMTGKGVIHKQAGVTESENYQNLKVVSNIQQRLLRQLKVSFMHLKRVYPTEVPQDLTIELTGAGSLLNATGLTPMQSNQPGNAPASDVPIKAQTIKTYDI